MGTEELHDVAVKAPRPLLASQVPRLPYVMTDTISTGFTTWTTRFQYSPFVGGM